MGNSSLHLGKHAAFIEGGKIIKTSTKENPV